MELGNSIETEDDAEFNAVVDDATEFDKRSGIAIVRLTALIKNYKKCSGLSDPTTLRKNFSEECRGHAPLAKTDLVNLQLNGCHSPIFSMPQ